MFVRSNRSSTSNRAQDSAQFSFYGCVSSSCPIILHIAGILQLSYCATRPTLGIIILLLATDHRRQQQLQPSSRSDAGNFSCSSNSTSNWPFVPRISFEPSIASCSPLHSALIGGDADAVSVLLVLLPATH